MLDDNYRLTNETVDVDASNLEVLSPQPYESQPDKRQLPEQKPFSSAVEPSTGRLTLLAEWGGSLDFLRDEPDLYSLEDGEALHGE
ncbi:hypothetical protein GKIL_1025 [Gloeobacter kilaueensis JS1]|uniref:Uncharacterized protein n=1 Tax=Gloeobacter kilaueensis (strain ATCC BAA-2537 / CCAP 1431/1 / ULC 316 / JS1) TaxID=1183438 RepID=U5QEC0_GLOK1|nr:hypothetical protein GKIL_1025 [Gloeobacter kilaueensis JS1]